MQEKIESICRQALAEIQNAKNTADIEDIKVKYLSRSGELNTIKKNLKDVPPDLRPKIGMIANNVAKTVEDALNEKKNIFYKEELNKKLEKERIDVTLEGSYVPLGKVHPLTQTINEITEIFQLMGYTLTENCHSPEVEVERYNFDLLNFPKDHPAKDMQDTFYCANASNVVLRSHTSNAQVRTMENTRPPVKIISAGRVYRSETISARKYNLFHQIEGLYVDKNVTMGDLKGTLNEFIRLYFGKARPTRFRTSFFPFTEPSVEIDVQCIMCEGKGCRTCSGSGWLEILGAGMVDVNVLKSVDIDPDIFSGFAFGMGVERLTMLKYAIDDIRLFFNNDTRFLKQF